MVLSMCACGNNGSTPGETGEQPSGQQSESKELTIGYVGNYNTFCPSTGLSDVSDVLIYRLVYDQLIEVNDKTM